VGDHRARIVVGRTAGDRLPALIPAFVEVRETRIRVTPSAAHEREPSGVLTALGTKVVPLHGVHDRTNEALGTRKVVTLGRAATTVKNVTPGGIVTHSVDLDRRVPAETLGPRAVRPHATRNRRVVTRASARRDRGVRIRTPRAPGLRARATADLLPQSVRREDRDPKDASTRRREIADPAFRRGVVRALDRVPSDVHAN